MTTLDARFRRCDHIGAVVRIDRTEGQCRDQYQCSLDRCPLEDKFSDGRPKITLQRIAAGWCGLFPATPADHE